VDPTFGEFGDHLGLEHHVPAVDALDAQRVLHLLDIVADAGRAPHIIDRIGVFGIVFLGPVRDHVPHVGQVWQLRLVKLLEHAGLDLPGQERARRHHHVVAGSAGEQLGLQDFVGIEDVVDDLDAGFLGEVLQDRLVDIIGPVVDVDGPLLGGRAEGQDGRKRGGGEQRDAA
jgi:hypothetical protein